MHKDTASLKHNIVLTFKMEDTDTDTDTHYYKPKTHNDWQTLIITLPAPHLLPITTEQNRSLMENKGHQKSYQ